MKFIIINMAWLFYYLGDLFYRLSNLEDYILDKLIKNREERGLVFTWLADSYQGCMRIASYLQGDIEYGPWEKVNDRK
jgi:hypothetical protein